MQEGIIICWRIFNKTLGMKQTSFLLSTEYLTLELQLQSVLEYALNSGSKVLINTFQY